MRYQMTQLYALLNTNKVSLEENYIKKFSSGRSWKLKQLIFDVLFHFESNFNSLLKVSLSRSFYLC